MWRARGKSDKIQLSFKNRIYPTSEEKLLRVMQVEAKVYNALLDIVNNARKEGKKITPKDTQDMLKDLKIEGKELVYSKVLQMVNNQLWYNINMSWVSLGVILLPSFLALFTISSNALYTLASTCITLRSFSSTSLIGQILYLNDS